MPAFLFRVPVPFLAVEVKRRSRYRGSVEFPEGNPMQQGQHPIPIHGPYSFFSKS
jgi:hypothetical protein